MKQASVETLAPKIDDRAAGRDGDGSPLAADLTEEHRPRLACKTDSQPCTSETVLSLLRRQATLYARLEAFAAQQRSVVAAEDTASLLAILSDRQRLSLELGRVAESFEPIRRCWSEIRARLSQPQQTEADGLLADIKHRLRKVIDADEQDARLLSARRQRAADDLRSLQSTHRVVHAYAGRSSIAQPVTFDEAT